jgi:ubiquinone/menaquinone biosynthesis C-methylase UbiE
MGKSGDSVNQECKKNADPKVVADFGSEWTRFNQNELMPEEHQVMFDNYFKIFPWDKLPNNSVGVDVGCGSGRWAALVLPKVGHLHCVDASKDALRVARSNLKDEKNVDFQLSSVDELQFTDNSMDFVYSLGVLHHVPDTAAAVKSIARILKPGAPMLLYLYYAFDNRPLWFRILWQISDFFRRIVSRLPVKLKHFVCDIIAISVYWPVARLGALLDKLNLMPASWPLSYYRDKEFYTLRTDALDRFGTRLEPTFHQGTNN